MITILDTPFEIASVSHSIVFNVESDATASDLRIRAQINYSTDGLAYQSLGTLYGSRIGDTFTFDFSQRLATVLSLDMPYIAQGVNSHFERLLPDSIVTYRVTFAEQYSNAQGLLTQYETATSSDFLAINARYLREDQYSIEPYILSAQATSPYGKFLTDSPDIKQIRQGEFEVINFLSNAIGTHNIKIGIQRSNAPMSVQVLDSDTLGMRMGQVFLSVDDYYTDDLQFIELWITDSNDVRISPVKRLMLDRSCGHAAYRLLWRNTKGGLDAYTFLATDEQTVQYEREQAAKRLNALNDLQQHESIITRSTRRKTIQTSSKYETYQTRAWLAELFSSPQVWLVEPTTLRLRPIYINNTDYTVQRNRSLLQVPVSFSFDEEQLV